ncbi:hypothetical protein SASPL_109101 [Salvia splendens]|uniref:N(6)-L-threonylcarbamoyladenine synthase n=1 Tax=Salvia splendens TaxID=180675 RepID=A0A8X8YJF8_SALSN|nr:hypothetical protein SASPL_109101 [Salvia splendens]
MPSIRFSTKAVQNLQFIPKLSRPLTPFLHRTTDFVSVHYSSCRKARAINASSQDEELVVLGIETSCDDTAAAVVSSEQWRNLSQVVSSQADLLVRYGGVAPKMAEEAHSLVIDQVVQEALDKAKLTEEDLSAVAVIIGPGLSLCLRVGVRKARKLAGAYALPIIGVHRGSPCLGCKVSSKRFTVPFHGLPHLSHNLLVLARDLGHYIQLGTAIDDAIGEAYDKTAKWLGLHMRKSGGPAVVELAREGSHETAQTLQFLICSDAAIHVAEASEEDRKARADIAASFQRVAVLHLEEKCERAIEWAMEIEPSVKHLVVSGGVASNQYVRSHLNKIVEKKGLQLVCPPPSLCTDNGTMIAWAGIEHFCMGRYDPPPPACEPEDAVLDLRPRWPLGEELAQGRSEARSMKTARIHPSLTSLIQASMQQQQP